MRPRPCRGGAGVGSAILGKEIKGRWNMLYMEKTIPSPTGTGKHDNVPIIIVNYRFIVGN